jgi:hypothetical protein
MVGTSNKSVPEMAIEEMVTFTIEMVKFMWRNAGTITMFFWW